MTDMTVREWIIKGFGDAIFRGEIVRGVGFDKASLDALRDGTPGRAVYLHGPKAHFDNVDLEEPIQAMEKRNGP